MRVLLVLVGHLQRRFFFFLFFLPACRGTLSVLQFLLDPETLFFMMFHTFYMKTFFLENHLGLEFSAFQHANGRLVQVYFQSKIGLTLESGINVLPKVITFWNFFQGLWSYYGLKRPKSYYMKLHILGATSIPGSRVWSNLLLPDDSCDMDSLSLKFGIQYSAFSGRCFTNFKMASR